MTKNPISRRNDKGFVVEQTPEPSGVFTNDDGLHKPVHNKIRRLESNIKSVEMVSYPFLSDYDLIEQFINSNSNFLNHLKNVHGYNNELMRACITLFNIFKSYKIYGVDGFYKLNENVFSCVIIESLSRELGLILELNTITQFEWWSNYPSAECFECRQLTEKFIENNHTRFMRIEN